jgi:hypothetical protein
MEHTHVTITLRELKTIVGQDEALRVMARPILRAAAVMERTCGEFSSWNIDDNYVSFDAQLQGGGIVVKNAYLHAIAETLLGSYPDHRTTMPADNRTTVQDMEAMIANIRQVSDIDVDTDLYKCETLMLEGKPALHAEGPKIEFGVPVPDVIPSSAHQDIPPEDDQRLASDAIAVMQKINGLHNRNFTGLFQNIDLLQGIFNLLKPTHDPVFRFQRDHQHGGLIYWQGYRKWFYLLQEDKKTASDAPEKQYLNVLYPRKKSSDMRRKFWVAMDCDLREKVVNKEMTLTDAMDAASKNLE